MIIYLSIYALFCVVLAKINAEMIEDGMKIDHKLNGALHITWAICAVFFEWYHPLTVLFTGRVLFDVSLNLFRGLKVGYVSPGPESVIDRAEKKVFGNSGLLPKVIYAAIIALLVTACTYEKEIQVDREIMTLNKVRVESRGEGKITILEWVDQNGIIYLEYSDYPCFIPEGTKMIMLLRK